jgi:hypothetical protein
MMAVSTEQEVRSFEVVKEEKIAASAEIVFESILEQMGPFNETPDGTSLAMKLEAWPASLPKSRYQRPPGNQAADAAGNLRAALHVFSGHVECAIPVDGRRRLDAFEICTSRDGADSV